MFKIFIKRIKCHKKAIIIFLYLSFLFSCNQRMVTFPDIVAPVPTQYQLDWQKRELIAFVHFTVNTFSDKEWGYGDEDPNVFFPAEFNADQWAEVLKKAGFTGAILTCKHHDGFCLWPSKYTNHSVKNIKWQNGDGDVVRAFKNACDKYGLDFGIYLSPWDRNRADYGSPSYIEYYQNQLRELLENYGTVFELWFDGANGGDGYYGGARETRRIDDQTYYNWPETYAIVKNYNPSTIIQGDVRATPDCRWCGNEKGYAGVTNWNIISPDTVKIFGKEFKDRIHLLNKGSETGSHWIPAEVDVSIRPGWFYHKEEDSMVKSADELFDIYLTSVGRGSNLLLNVAPDKRGLIPDEDIRSLQEWKNKLDKTFAVNLALDAKVSANTYRGKSKQYAASKVNDGKEETYWATDDDILKGSLEFEFTNPKELQYFVIQEYIQLGQRVKSFNVELFYDDAWHQVATETTIGYKRIIKIDPVKTTKVRFNITDSKACPVISNIEIY